MQFQNESKKHGNEHEYIIDNKTEYSELLKIPRVGQIGSLLVIGGW